MYAHMGQQDTRFFGPAFTSSGMLITICNRAKCECSSCRSPSGVTVPPSKTTTVSGCFNSWANSQQVLDLASAGHRLWSRNDIGLLQICPIKSAEPQGIGYGVQGFEHPALLHVGKRRPYLVWSLAGSTSICVVVYLLIVPGYGFIPLVDLFISPGSELDIAFACFLHTAALRASSLSELEMSSNDTVPCDMASSSSEGLCPLHLQQHSHHLALGLLQVMQSESVLSYWSHYLLKVLETLLGSQCHTHHWSLIPRKTSCWNQMLFLTWAGS